MYSLVTKSTKYNLNTQVNVWIIQVTKLSYCTYFLCKVKGTCCIYLKVSVNYFFLTDSPHNVSIVHRYISMAIKYMGLCPRDKIFVHVNNIFIHV